MASSVKRGTLEYTLIQYQNEVLRLTAEKQRLAHRLACIDRVGNPKTFNTIMNQLMKVEENLEKRNNMVIECEARMCDEH